MEDPKDNESPFQPSLSEVGLENTAPQKSNRDESDEKWQQLLEQQNRNFLTLVKAMKTPSCSSELCLPDFNPEKVNVDARAWISTADLCIDVEHCQGAQLMVALSRALKGQASTWLSTVSFPGMTWSDFKELFTQRYDCPETTASFLINLHESKPKDNECLATYAASLMTSIMSRWKDLTTEQLAIATVLAHVSRFDQRVQRLSFTTEVSSRNQLQQELRAVSFLKRKVPCNEYTGSDPKKVYTSDTPAPVKCFYCGKLGHKSTVCLSRRRDLGRPEERPNSQKEDNFKTSPASGMKPSVTCFNCQAQGHYASSCPKRHRREGSSSGASTSKEKRVDLCTVVAPSGNLRRKDTSHEDV